MKDGSGGGGGGGVSGGELSVAPSFLLSDHPSTPARLPHSVSQSSPASALFSSSYLGLQSSPLWSSLSPLPQTGGFPVPAASHPHSSHAQLAASVPTAAPAASSLSLPFRVPLTPLTLTPSSLEMMSPSAQPLFGHDEGGGGGGGSGGAASLSTPQLYKSPQKFTFVTPSSSQQAARAGHPQQQQQRDSSQPLQQSTLSSAASNASSSSGASSSSSSASSSSGSKRPSYVQRLDFSTPDSAAEKRRDKGGEGEALPALRSGLPLLSPSSFSSPMSAAGSIRFFNGSESLLSPYHPSSLSTLSPFVPPARLDPAAASSSSSSSLSTPAAASGRPSSPPLFSPAPGSSHLHHGGFSFASPLFPASPSTSSLLFSPASAYPSPSALNASSGGNALHLYQSSPFLSLPTGGNSALLLTSPSSSLLSPASYTSSPSSFSSSHSSATSSSHSSSPLHPSAQAAAAAASASSVASPLLSASAPMQLKQLQAIPMGIAGPHPYLSSLLPLPLSSSASSSSSLSAASLPSSASFSLSSKACNCKKSKCLDINTQVLIRLSASARQKQPTVLWADAATVLQHWSDAEVRPHLQVASLHTDPASEELQRQRLRVRAGDCGGVAGSRDRLVWAPVVGVVEPFVFSSAIRGGGAPGPSPHARLQRSSDRPAAHARPQRVGRACATRARRLPASAHAPIPPRAGGPAQPRLGARCGQWTVGWLEAEELGSHRHSGRGFHAAVAAGAAGVSGCSSGSRRSQPRRLLASSASQPGSQLRVRPL